MKTCPGCKATNATDARFCGQCMTPLPPSGGKTCPAGHSMEPDWTECAYCRSDKASQGPGVLLGSPPVPVPTGYVRRPTVVEGTGQVSAAAVPGTVQSAAYQEPLPPRPAPRPFKPVPVPASQLSRPNIPPAGPPPAARKTEYRPLPPSGPMPIPPPPALAQRRIVGVLVTYSWKPDGEIFPIREGRNLIGRDPDCEVCISVDQTMSGRNSHVSFRTAFVVGDLVSMKGTDMNGIPIEQQFLSLPNYAVIRAGSTQFTFVAIQPPPAPSQDPPAGLDTP